MNERISVAKRARRRSFGSITEVSKTKYIVRWVENTPEGRRRKSQTLNGTYKDACRYLSIKEVEHGREKRTPTVGEAYEMWYLPHLDSKLASGKMKQSTVDKYLRCWRSYIEPRWANTPLDGVKAIDIQSWVSSMPRANASASLIVLRGILDLAVRYDIIDANVARREYELPTNTTTERTKSIYTYEQAMAAWRGVEGTAAEPGFILACFGGARSGESLGVTLDDVSFKETGGVRFAYVDIRRQMPQWGIKPSETLKTAQSARTTLIPQPYSDRLREIAEERERKGRFWLADRGDGYPMSRGTLNHQMKALLGEDAIPASNLRPTWRTIAEFTWRLPYDCMELLMGHMLPGVSGSHYIRPTIEDLAAMFATAYRGFLDGE